MTEIIIINIDKVGGRKTPHPIREKIREMRKSRENARKSRKIVKSKRPQCWSISHSEKKLAKNTNFNA